MKALIICFVVVLLLLALALIIAYRRFKKCEDSYPLTVKYSGLPNKFTYHILFDRDSIKLLLHRNEWWSNFEISDRISLLRNKYPNGWKIIRAKYPSISDREMVGYETEIKDTEEIYTKEQNIEKHLAALKNAEQKCDIETANFFICSLQEEKKHPKIDYNLVEKVNTSIWECVNHYNQGINDVYGDCYVNYDVPNNFVQSSDWKYCVAKFPKKGTHLFTHRRRKIARRGYAEEDFQMFLSDKLRASNISVIGDCALLPFNGYRPYEPDIAIIDLENPSIRIDIEIDEPYAAITNKPTHFVGCGDEVRDIKLNNLGWIVVRFTEKQVFTERLNCTCYIVNLIHALSPNKDLPKDLLNGPQPTQQNRWTEIEAQVMASRHEREHYLDHKFGDQDVTPANNTDMQQTPAEKVSASKMQPILLPTAASAHPTVSVDKRDLDIQFDPQEHVYIYKGGEEFTPVSNVIEYFFKPFDSFYWSERKAAKMGVAQWKVLADWEIKGEKARQIGIFMHQQIENYYAGKEYLKTFDFQYKDSCVEERTTISLENEYAQFLDFQKKSQCVPFRTEWSIYDEDFKIAGTIDMLCKNPNNFDFDMYDWKRSQRIVDRAGNLIKKIPFGNGINGLEKIPDTPYWHYCIQQNLYRYILEKKYGLTIRNMHLVVFCESLQNSCLLQIPRMDAEIDIILHHLPLL